MAVAKSYENFEIISEPFEKDGKDYVLVKGICSRCCGTGEYSFNGHDSVCYKCNGRKFIRQEVRWYTDKERAAQDRAAKKREEERAKKAEEIAIKHLPRNRFGFGEAGFITLFCGDPSVVSNWLKGKHIAKFDNVFRWYLPSDMEMPMDIPEGVTTEKLLWEEVMDADEPQYLIDDELISAIVEKKIYPKSNSKYFDGAVGDRINCEVTLKSAKEIEGRYGYSTVFSFVSKDGNDAVWITSSTPKFEVGNTYKIAGTIKDFKTFRGSCQTILSRVKIMN